MKKIALIIPVLLVPLMLTAQTKSIDKLFKKYYGKEGFTTVLVNKDMFEVIANMEESKGEIDGTLGKIERVRVIAQEDEADVEAVNFMEELKGVEFDDYKELVVVKEAGQEVGQLYHERPGGTGRTGRSGSAWRYPGQLGRTVPQRWLTLRNSRDETYGHKGIQGKGVAS